MVTSFIIASLVSRVRKQAEEVLSSVSYKVIEAEEAERQRIAKDLHEGIGQRVTLLVIEIEQLKAGLLNGVEMASRIDGVLKQSLEILTDVKTLAHELYSPRLEYLGIAGVMRTFCREFGEQKRIEIDFRSDGLPNFASVITLKPANGDQVKTGQRERPGQDCFTPPIPLAASLFLCANCGDRI